MTRQEPHTCDVCGEMFHVPQDPLRTLKIGEGGEDLIEYDLCFDCHRLLLEWIQKRRGEA